MSSCIAIYSNMYDLFAVAGAVAGGAALAGGDYTFAGAFGAGGGVTGGGLDPFATGRTTASLRALVAEGRILS
jgi:hypothetical protein